MLWRTVCAGYLGAVAAFVVLLFVGSCLGDLSLLLSAVPVGGVGLVLRNWLRRHSEARLEEEEFPVEEAGSSSREASDGGSAGELAGLLADLKRMEEARRSRDFDPWALQSLRAEIRELVKADPGVRRVLGIDRN